MKQKADFHLFEAYKNKLKHEKRVVFVWQFIIFIGFFAIWEIASSKYLIDPLLFSSPSKIVHLLFDKFSDGSMITHVQVTLFETLIGFIIGTVLGIKIASALCASDRFYIILYHYLVLI